MNPMTTSDVMNTINGIPIGTVVAWGAVVISIVYGFKKIFKMLESMFDLKEEREEFKKLVDKHDEKIRAIEEKHEREVSSLDKKLDNVILWMEEKDKNDLEKLRYSIVRAGEEYISAGKVSIRQLSSLEALFSIYTNKHGNGYVKTLMNKVRQLPVHGRLDNDGNDIEEEQD